MKKSDLLTLASIAFISLLGILASFLFQVLTARNLGPSEFGSFASFLAIVNIVAIGSGALQNAVTVQTAKMSSKNGDSLSSTKSDSSIFEALTIGATLFAGLAIFSNGISKLLNFSVEIAILAALSAPISFIWARNAGIIQGHGLGQKTINLSTLHAVIRLGLGVFASIFALQLFGFALAVIFSSVLIALIASRTLRNLPLRPNHIPFDKATTSIFLSSLAFAWLTNIDVVYIRANLDAEIAGNFAAVSLIVKTGFLVPSVLSLHFLPKFVGDKSGKKALVFPVIITVLGIGILTTLLWLLGSNAGSVVLGGQFSTPRDLLMLVCFSSAPWIISQTILILTNAQAKGFAPVFLILVAILQFVLFSITLPDIEFTLLLNAILGLLVAVGLAISASNKRVKLG